MKIGEKATIICPPEYAYGEKGMPPRIPENATLKFDLEVLDFEGAPRHNPCSYCTIFWKDILQNKAI